MNEKVWRIVACCLVPIVFGLMWRCDNLASRLDVEMAGHVKTRTELEHAMGQVQSWTAAYLEAMDAAGAQKKLAEACLAREFAARADAETRKAILAPVKPRPRTAEEHKKVVDDETRARVADRLNRPL